MITKGSVFFILGAVSLVAACSAGVSTPPAAQLATVTPVIATLTPIAPASATAGRVDTISSPTATGVPTPTRTATAVPTLTPTPIPTATVTLPASTATPTVSPRPTPTPMWVQSECYAQRIDRVAACKDHRDHTTPVLGNLMVEFGPWDRATNMAGAFAFAAQKNRVFYEFGYVISPEKINISFTYDVGTTVTILAPMGGVVTSITYQSVSDDYELHIRKAAMSDWIIILDHVKDVPVKVGDTVTAGQVVGKASIGVPGYRTTPEIQINEEIIDDSSTFEHRVRGKTRFHCPSSFVSAETRAKVESLMRDWEAFKGRAVYPASMALPGCTTLFNEVVN